MLNKSDNYLTDNTSFIEREKSKINDEELDVLIRVIDDGSYVAMFGAPTLFNNNNGSKRIVLNLYLEHQSKRYLINQSFNLDFQVEELYEVLYLFGIDLRKVDKPKMSHLKPLIGQKVVIETENIVHNDKTYTNIVKFHPFEEGEENWGI